jgi:erythromycin esterase
MMRRHLWVDTPVLGSLARRALLLGVPTVLCAATPQPPERIERSTRLTQSLAPGDVRAYALRLGQGESAVVSVLQQGIDVVVEVRSPSGRLLDTIDGPTGRSGEEVAEIIAEEDGTYGLTVRPLDDKEPPGRYVLEVRSVRGTAETGEVLRRRRDARAAASRWLSPRSASLPRPGVPGPRALAPLDALARRGTVLGIGEATHGSREFGDLRLWLTRALVERHGFRILALEASASAMSRLGPYLRGTSARTPEVEALLESGWIGRRARGELIDWVRRWNTRHPGDPLTVVGVDAQDNGPARRTLRAFLSRAYGEPMLKQWAPAEQELAAADEQTLVFGDSRVDGAARQRILELLARLELDAPTLRVRFGSQELDAALEAARTLAEFADFNSAPDTVGARSRDWFMAGRVLRAREGGGAPGKTIYWAHNAHVVHPPGSERTTGGLLRQALGCGYAAIALTFDEGAFIAQIPSDPQDRLAASTLPAAPDESIEGVLRPLHPEGTLATWTCPTPANASVPEWLRRAHPMHWVGGLHRPDTAPSAAFREFDLLRDFDGVALLPVVTAEPIPGDRPLVAPRKR